MKSDGCKTTFRLHAALMVALIIAAILPSAGGGEESATKAQHPRTYEDLMNTTYLGHAAESPDPDEPVEVLQRYLDQGHYGQEVTREMGREITIWKRLAQRYPNSRYAYAGLGRAYRMRYDKEKNPKDLQRAIDGYSRASWVGLAQGRIVYTKPLSDMIVEARSVEQLDRVFLPMITAGPGLRAKEYYLALVDYAYGLSMLGDERAWNYFEEAITLKPQGNAEAINRYADRLLKSGRASQALDLLEKRLTRADRIRRVMPVYLRLTALKQLNMDTSTADDEVKALDKRFEGGIGIANSTSSVVEKWAHTNAADDCRDARYATTPIYSVASQKYFYPYLINLAEIIFNEARGEDWGQMDMVGWTVRNRVLQGVSCDSYRGGVNWHTTCATLPCGDGNTAFCDLSRWYCCAEHGATTTVSATSVQFNDTHVAIADLDYYNLPTESWDIMNGRIPDPSTGFIPSGISDCTTGCGGFCTTGANTGSPSPQGPMEYLDHNYCAAASTCKWYSGNICGSLPYTTNCTTGGNRGDNHFWNKYN